MFISCLLYGGLNLCNQLLPDTKVGRQIIKINLAAQKVIHDF